MPRPALPARNRLTAIVRARVTPEESALFRASAKRAKVKMSLWVRSTLADAAKGKGK